MPELTQRLVGVMSDRIREVTRLEQQRDRLAALGKLSAGLAHELNNPASAATRATSLLREALQSNQERSQELGRHDLTAAQRAEIEKLEASFLQPVKRRSIRWPSAIWKIRLIRCCAVMDRAIFGNWRPTWRNEASSRRCWSLCSRLSTQILPALRW